MTSKNISLNCAVLDSITSPANFKIINVLSVLNDIKTEKYKALIDALPRADTDKKAYTEAKRHLPSWALNGEFKGKVINSGFVESNGLFHIDIDNVENPTAIKHQLVRDIPEIYALWGSPSGTGLKGLLRVPDDLIKNDTDFKKAFEQIQKYLAVYDIEIDKACKDVRRLCFVCSDSDIYINEAAPAFVFDSVRWDYKPIVKPAAPAPFVSSNQSDRYINRCCEMILNAGAGNYHNARLRAGKLAGGFIAAGYVNEHNIMQALSDASDAISAQSGDKPDVIEREQKTIYDAIQHGKAQPVEQQYTPLFTPLIDMSSAKPHGTPAHKEQDNEESEESKAIRKAVADAYEAHTAKFNKNHAQVLIGGKHRIMRTVPATATHDNRDAYEFLSQDSLVRIYQNTQIQTGFNKKGEPVIKDYLTAWAKHFKSRVYTGGVIFKPAAPVIPDYFNTWQGYTVTPQQNHDLWASIKHHIDEVICASEQAQIDYFYNWVAYTFQHPDKPAGAALVLRGGKGTGKGTIGHFLRKIWGVHALHISNSKHLTGNFNGHLNDVCFLFADEAFFSADKQHEGVLKALITEPTVTIERKGIDATSQPNYLKVFMATNNDWAVPASKDERRYGVFDVSSENVGDKDYFDSLHNDCNNKDVQAAFLYDMLNRDISNFHTGNIPDTVGLQAQRMQSLDSVGKWLVDSLNAGYFEQNDKAGYFEQNDKAASEWQPLMTAKALYDSYLFWCDNMRKGEYTRASQTAVGNYFADIGYSKHKRRNGNQWQLGNIEEAIKKFESFERVKIQLSTLTG